MHVKRATPPRHNYNPAEEGTELDGPLDPDIRRHWIFKKYRPFPIKGDDRQCGYYPNIPAVPASLRPKQPVRPYDDAQLRLYRNEPVSLEPLPPLHFNFLAVFLIS